MTPRDFIFFALSVGVAGLIGNLTADRLCPRNYPRWLPFLPVLAFVGVTGVHRSGFRNFGWRAGVAIVVVQMAVYFAIYVITLLELNDHLASSLNRLMMHFWPACLLLAGMTFQSRAQLNAAESPS